MHDRGGYHLVDGNVCYTYASQFTSGGTDASQEVAAGVQDGE
jgi:hypothetical protein